MGDGKKFTDGTAQVGDVLVDMAGKTPEEIEEEIARLRNLQAQKRQDEAADKERLAKKLETNRFWISVRGIAADVDAVKAAIAEFVEQKLKTLCARADVRENGEEGHEVHYAEFGSGEPGRESKTTLHE